MQIALLEFQSKFVHKTSNYYRASSLALESIAKISNLCTSVPQSDRKPVQRKFLTNQRVVVEISDFFCDWYLKIVVGGRNFRCTGFLEDCQKNAHAQVRSFWLKSPTKLTVSCCFYKRHMYKNNNSCRIVKKELDLKCVTQTKINTYRPMKEG